VGLTNISLVDSGSVIPEKVEIKLRYQTKPIMGMLRVIDNEKLEISLVKEADSIAAGQSGVLYEGEKMLGGGIIL